MGVKTVIITDQYHTGIDVLNVPDEDTINEAIQYHHQQNHEKVVLVSLNRRDVDVGVLNPDTHFLIISKVLRPQTKRSCGKKGLQQRETT